MKTVDCPDTVNKRSCWTVGLGSNSDQSLKFVADPGFSLWGGTDQLRASTPKRVLFGRNLYGRKNWVMLRGQRPPDPPMEMYHF